MHIAEEPVTALVRRLRRAEGQIRASSGRWTPAGSARDRTADLDQLRELSLRLA